MADIDNQQIVSWSNNRSRPICDKITQLIYAMQAYQTDYINQNIGATLDTLDPNEKIADGYMYDGRQPITCNQLINLEIAINQILVALTQTEIGNTNQTLSQISSSIQVNGSPR